MDIQLFLESGAIIKTKTNQLYVGFGECIWKTFKQIEPATPAFYFPDFFLQSAAPWLQYEQTQEISIEDLLALMPGNPILSPLKWELPGQKNFVVAFEGLQKAFANSNLVKAVPYSFSHCHQVMSPLQLYASLKSALKYIQKYPGFIYGFWNKSEGLLGVTPELLFELHDDKENQKLSTVALAGTCSKDQDSLSFLDNAKERQEHQITVSGITDSLKSLGTVKIGDLQVLELPHLNHLLTRIEVHSKRFPSFEKLVKVLHPTPALGAYPKENGWVWLRSYQTQINRDRFGAPVGLLFSGQIQALCLVAIRNVQWNFKDGMKIGAGCGIVPSSQPDREWKEIQLKMEAIQHFLCLLS